VEQSQFEVKVIGVKEESDCECGLFAHMVMLCGHALEVKRTITRVFVLVHALNHVN
jgi:hypothetical protein